MRDLNTGCLLWAGAVNSSGYARTKAGYLHRILWEDLNGPVPDGMELDHLCGVTYCIEPTHLEAVTHAENMARYAARRAP